MNALHLLGFIPARRAERLDAIRADRIARGGEPAPLDRAAVLREAVASHRLSGAECPYCGIDADDLTLHDCHCLRVDGERVAVGICCGRMLGDVPDVPTPQVPGDE